MPPPLNSNKKQTMVLQPRHAYAMQNCLFSCVTDQKCFLIPTQTMILNSSLLAIDKDVVYVIFVAMWFHAN